MTGATTSWANCATVCLNASCSWLSMVLLPRFGCRPFRVPAVPGAGRRGSTTSDRSNPVAPVREMARLSTGQSEPAHEVGAQIGHLDDRVDDELACQSHDVDVALVGLPLGRHERRPLLFAQRGDLIRVYGVDRRLGAHHGDLR